MRRADLALAYTLRVLCMTCLVLLFMIILLSVVNRFAAFMSMGWSDEIIELLFAWLVFLGAASLWRENSHFCVDLLKVRLAGTRSGRTLDLFLILLGLLFLGTFVFYSWLLLSNASDDSPVFAISKQYWYGVMPASGVVMMIYSLRDLWLWLKGSAATKGLQSPL
ncbi:MAG: TRAP transporter small permease subunit [Alcaligenaceae bacterium]|nr:TRAP transporter small permease subunit [Alcaligenaceae bacterium]